MSRRLRFVLLATVSAAVFLAPSVARAHNPSVHWFPIQAHGGVITYVDAFTGHWGFHMNVETTWSNVGDACGYLHYYQFYYYNVSRPVYAGASEIEHNGWKDPAWPDPRTYYSAGWSNPVTVNMWLCGGYAGGRLGVIIRKHNPDFETEPHLSQTVWYRP